MKCPTPWGLAAILAGMLAACVPCRAADPPDRSAEVKVYEGTRSILTGPFKLKGLAPQERLGEFKPVAYPAVFIENEYLRCCVLPTVGGRLYEVYSKASKSQVFFVNPYLETHPDDFEGGHPWNLGGVEVNFPYFHHGNTYNDRWQWAQVRRPDGSAGVAMGFTSRPTMQRAVFRVILRPGVARVDLEYRFENLNPYSWGLAAWIDTMHPKTMDTQFILPTPWVAQHGYNASRTDVLPWPIRNGVDLSWQKNLPAGKDLSEFAFMPRRRFHGCYDYKADRGAVRVFDAAGQKALPAAKIWTQAPPVTPQQYYQHFEIWTATSAVMEDPGHQAELSAHAAADGWYQVWGIGGYVLANENAAVNLVRLAGGKVLAGVCGTRRIPNCVVSLCEGHTTLYRQAFDLDPSGPWRKELPAPAGDVTISVIAPDGKCLAAYELRHDELPREQWVMPAKPRWRDGINAAYYEETYSTLWRRRGHFLDGAINRFAKLLKDDPKSARLMVDLARAHLKDQQVRVGMAYRDPGPQAELDAARRRQADLASAVELLGKAIEIDPANASARLYLGLALERQGKSAEAVEQYRAALKAGAPVAGMYLARRAAGPFGVLKSDPARAVALARQAAAAYPQSARARQVLLAALAAAGKTDEAVALGESLRELDPADPLVPSLLAEALRRAGKAQAAAAATQEAQRLCADDPQAAAGLRADMSWLRGEAAGPATGPGARK